MTTSPDQIWWSAAELAEAGLPELPGTKRGVTLLAKRQGWASHPGKTKRRKEQGGGVEYHWTLLPVQARTALLKQADQAAPPEAPKRVPSEAWEAYEALKDAAKAKAEDRHRALGRVLDLEQAGLTRSLAVTEIASELGVSAKSIWNWFGLVEGVSERDWLAFLAPQFSGPKKAKTSIDEAFFSLVRDDYLRQAQPSLTSCYDRACKIAKAQGIPIAPIHQVRRHYKKAVSKPVEIYLRKGLEALRRSYPHQTRDKSAMVPLECVQGDYHKFDVFVRWPGESLPVRPMGVFFSDVYSGKLLAWRLSLTANSHTVQLTFGDLVDTYGIPQSALLDNGREFASKVLTGGAPTRFRFKVKDEDIPGMMPLLGIKVHWATPYSGQSKPIERAFLDLCDRVSAHPACEGAYTGNSPHAKPENYGNRAVPLEEFVQVLATEVRDHNAREDRRSEVAFGRSFDQVFNEGYATAPIRKATEEQKRMWLLRAEAVTASKKNGELALFGGRFWSEWMFRIAGQKVVARFDPDNLQKPLQVYDQDGVYLGEAAVVERGEFLNLDDAKTLSRKRSQFMRKAKDAAKAQTEYTAAEIAAQLRAAGQDVQADDLPVAEVVQLATPHSKAPKPSKSAEAATGGVTRLADHRDAAPVEDEDARFERALELEAMEADGQQLTDSQRAFLTDYRQSAAYRGRMRLRNAFEQNE